MKRKLCEFEWLKEKRGGRGGGWKIWGEREGRRAKKDKSFGE